MPTALMISVMNGKEATAALEGGADIIDIKNPNEGALGAPAPWIIEDIRTRTAGLKPFSIALGEFPGKPGALSLAALGSAYFQPDFVKVAFIPQQSSEEIEEILRSVKQSLSYAKHPSISLVAVVYADTLRYASWNLGEFAAISRQGGADGCLIDTWEKKNKSLPEFMPEKDIERWINDCRTQGLFCGLAGSLTYADIGVLRNLGPDIIGVRSAVCQGDRLRGTVSAQAVKELKQLLQRDSC